MAERPILFSGPMVRAILEGRKTQTRRVVSLPRNMEPLNEEGDFEIDDAFDDRGTRMDWPYAASKKTGCMTAIECPYGSPGDTLWVRETLGVTWQGDCEYMADRKEVSDPRAHALCERYGDRYHFSEVRKVPSIFMPRWASRFSLLVKRVRVERVQDISEADARAEGIVAARVASGRAFGLRDSYGLAGEPFATSARCAFEDLWDTINGKRAPWSSNPWVWVVEFKRVKENA